MRAFGGKHRRVPDVTFDIVVKVELFEKPNNTLGTGLVEPSGYTVNAVSMSGW